MLIPPEWIDRVSWEDSKARREGFYGSPREAMPGERPLTSSPMLFRRFASIGMRDQADYQAPNVWMLHCLQPPSAGGPQASATAGGARLATEV